MFVYVLNCHGEPLMPCRPRKARMLLKTGKATVVKMVPFTLQLRYGSSGYKQEVSLGIDAGTKHIGVSATTDKAVLFEAEAQPRTDMQEVLATRRQFRRARRNCKTRYRPCRLLNRRKPKGWLAPSVRHLVEAHLKTMRWFIVSCLFGAPPSRWRSSTCRKYNTLRLKGKPIKKGRNSAFGMCASMCCIVTSIAASGAWASRRTRF